MPSLLPTKDKIAIADRDYIAATAIFVLRVKNEKLTQRLFEYLKNNENEILYDI
jgi:hypothetical protein